MAYLLAFFMKALQKKKVAYILQCLHP